MEDYLYIRAWSNLIHPESSYFLDVNLSEARKYDAPQDALFRIDDRWICYNDITNKYIKRALDKLLNK